MTNPKLFATKITTTNSEGKTIISFEKLYQFACDITAERVKEIRLEDEVNRLSNERSTINLN